MVMTCAAQGEADREIAARTVADQRDVAVVIALGKQRVVNRIAVVDLRGVRVLRRATEIRDEGGNTERLGEMAGHFTVAVG